MTTFVETAECFPESAAAAMSAFFQRHIEPSEPAHERCPRGHHTPGVLGGWDCPCECHRRKYDALAGPPP